MHACIGEITNKLQILGELKFLIIYIKSNHLNKFQKCIVQPYILSAKWNFGGLSTLPLNCLCGCMNISFFKLKIYYTHSFIFGIPITVYWNQGIHHASIRHILNSIHTILMNG